jgi:hypothetical protein
MLSQAIGEPVHDGTDGVDAEGMIDIINKNICALTELMCLREENRELEEELSRQERSLAELGQLDLAGNQCLTMEDKSKSLEPNGRSRTSNIVKDNLNLTDYTNCIDIVSFNDYQNQQMPSQEFARVEGTSDGSYDKSYAAQVGFAPVMDHNENVQLKFEQINVEQLKIKQLMIELEGLNAKELIIVPGKCEIAMRKIPIKPKACARGALGIVLRTLEFDPGKLGHGIIQTTQSAQFGMGSVSSRTRTSASAEKNAVLNEYQFTFKPASNGGAAAADAASTKDFGAESSSVAQMQKVEKIKQLEAEVARLSGPSARVSQLEDMINRKQKLASLSNQSITEQMADAVIRLQTAQKNPFK